MTSTWPILLAAGAGALAARRRTTHITYAPAELDIWKSGEAMRLAADWLRAGDTEAALALLDLVGQDTWDFAHDEVVSISPIPRIAAMADRMSPDRLLTTPAGEPATADRITQVETLTAIAAAIRQRSHPNR